MLKQQCDTITHVVWKKNLDKSIVNIFKNQGRSHRFTNLQTGTYADDRNG